MKTTVALLIAGLCTAAAPALANPVQDRFTAAAASLDNRLGVDPRHPVAVEADDPVVTKALADMKASVDMLGTKAFPANEGTFDSVCERVTAVRNHVVAAGLNPAVQDQNLETLWQPLIQLEVMGAHCMALQIPYVSRAWMPDQFKVGGNRTAPALGVQAGSRGFFLKFTVGANTFPEISRGEYIREAAADAALYATVMPVAARKAVLDEITKKAPDIATKWPTEFAAVSAALSGTECSGLCTVQ